jgi:protein-S-isoprenylcysteine O-methyltransferase Ste14
MSNTRLSRAGVKRFIVSFVFTVLWGAVLFGSAGTLQWARGWIHIAATVLCLAVSSVLVVLKNPEVAAARSKMHRDAKGFDKIFSAFYGVIIFVVPAVAGLDAVRYAWSTMPFAAVYLGLLLYFAGTVPVTAALVTNRFLETQVRIQTDRGHQVVSSGPYRYVRHPMYIGVMMQHLASPLILGSWRTFVPTSAICFAFIWRTVLEDRTLLKELPGYGDFALQTRYRLIPGLW